MGGYVMGIVGAAAVVGIMDAMLPQNGKTKNYMRLIAALCLLCLVIRPIGEAVESLPALFGKVSESLAESESAARENYEEILEGKIQETVRQQLCEAIKGQMKTQFSVENCEVGIAFSREDEELRLVRAVITLSGKDIFKNPYAIEQYFSDLLGCECMVIVG